MIYKKLLEFQKLGISIRKDKRNPHFKNEYASLNEVLDKVKAELNKLDVVIEQKPGIEWCGTSCERGLRTRLHDTEDETYTESFTPFINPTDMQKLGGAITYARRYALVSMLALEDEDDDGTIASTKTTISPEQACAKLAQAGTLDELKSIFMALPKNLQSDVEVVAMKDEIKKKLTV